MAKNQLSGKALHDVHKIVFLANEYPGKTMREIAAMFYLPALDINAAIWRAEDLGYLVIDQETKKPSVDRVPNKWQFGEGVELLSEQLIYYFKHLARDEADLEENYMNNLTLGYPTHDVFIAIRQLLNDRVLNSYEIYNNVEIPLSKKAKARGKKPEIREEIYTFYSLWENSEQQWGRKQFKEATKLK